MLKPGDRAFNEVQLHQNVVDHAALAGHKQIFEHHGYHNPGGDDRQVTDHLERRLSPQDGIDQTCQHQSAGHLSGYRHQGIQNGVPERDPVALV